ncbi:hypothetical protein BV898_00694 [Hypsibius exemplaris]|uniref:Glycosyltransferase family 92 protein n=1 Tax=Hypsibius exemplaris TaxID=2072580 RepID=A0A1W0XEE4_HYPEX|nr:hypothetical protein BV898_00694 [Hypsibius exemplaris]
MLRNVFPYTLEWIEFHAVQGVDHFVLYDDDSRDESTTLIPLLYASPFHNATNQMLFPPVVEVVQANFFRNNRQSDHGSLDHDHNQRACLKHCHIRYKDTSTWMLIIDVDEFIYSPRHGTIRQFLQAYENYTDNLTADHVTEFQASAVRFGSSGLQSDFYSELLPNAFEGVLTVLFEKSVQGKEEPGLIIEANPRRAPHRELDRNFDAVFQATCPSIPNGPVKCQHALGKSIFRPDRCRKPYIHWCANLTSGTSINMPLAELRLDHFAWRSAESVSRMTSNWQGNKIIVFDQLDRVWFSKVEDEAKKPYVEPVRRALGRFPTTAVEWSAKAHPKPQWWLNQMAALGRHVTVPLFT